MRLGLGLAINQIWGGGLWNPAQIDTAAWFDASDLSTITESGGSVSQWDDKSGANHFVQAIGANQPITDTRTLNGLNAIDFNGTGAFMEHGTNLSFPDGLSIAVAFDQDSTATSKRIVGVYNAVSKASFVLDSDNYLRYDGAASAGSVSATIGAHIRVASKSANALVQTGFVDGSSNVSDTAALVDSASVKLNVGTPVVALNQFFNGIIGEIVLLDYEATTDNRQNLEGYLAWKWGMVPNLPVDHPYKTSPPMS